MLLAADQKQNNLKVYSGTNVLHTFALKGKPTCICTYYSSFAQPLSPVIAVAIEAQIYFFKDFEPLMRFDIPPVTFSAEEKKLWEELGQAQNDQKAFVQVIERFYALRESGVQISAKTAELISFEELGPQMQFFTAKKYSPLVHENYVTCMTRINKNLDGEKELQMLVIGTEHCQVLFMEVNG